MNQRENSRKLPSINEQIRSSKIRLIDENENMVGIIPTSEAIQKAKAADLDLVEVSPGSDPPVCRILDFGKYRYEQSKKERANRAKAKVVETKEVRLGRSMKIDQHDVDIRVNQARKFLLDGHKVLIVQNFRGREMMHAKLAHERMQNIIKSLEDVSKVETPPKISGRRETMVLAPDKVKIQQYLAATKKEEPEAPQQEEE